MPSAKATAAAAASLARLYGPTVQVRFYNVNDPEVASEHATTLVYINEEDFPLPVTFINGAVMFVGGLQPLKLVAVVADVLAQQGISLQTTPNG